MVAVKVASAHKKLAIPRFNSKRRSSRQDGTEDICSQ
jgi:hypothetical protein